jgi:hypothetical protein
MNQTRTRCYLTVSYPIRPDNGTNFFSARFSALSRFQLSRRLRESSPNKRPLATKPAVPLLDPTAIDNETENLPWMVQFRQARDKNGSFRSQPYQKGVFSGRKLIIQTQG